MTKVKDGFYHQLSSKIGDNDYLLKAGGGYIGVGNGEYMVPFSNYSPNDALYARTSRNLLINGVTWYSNWYWSGQEGQPTWLWGSNDGTNMYVWNPRNFSVDWADRTAHLLINGNTWWSNWNWDGRGGSPTWIWGSSDCGSNNYLFHTDNLSVGQLNDFVRVSRVSKDSSNNEIETVTGYRTSGFIQVQRFCPPSMYRTTEDQPAPYGIGFGNGSESGGIMPVGSGDYLQDIIFYGANSGPTYFRFGRQIWESTSYDSRCSNRYETYAWINSTTGRINTNNSFTFKGYEPIIYSSENTIAGYAGEVYFGGNFHIDSIRGYALYLNYYYANDVSIAQGGGKVGVGQLGGTYKFNVIGTSYSSQTIYSGVSSSTDLTHIPSDSEVALTTGNGNGAVSAWIWRENYASSNWGIFHNNSTDYIHFVGGNTARLSIDLGGGNVGIGNSSPSYKLDVSGDTRILGNLYLGANASNNFIAFYGNTGDDPGYYQTSFIGEHLWGGSESTELLLMKFNDGGNGTDSTTASGAGPDRIRHLAHGHVFQIMTDTSQGDFVTMANSSAVETKFDIARYQLHAYAPLAIISDGTNSGYDGLVYMRHYSNNDWGLIVDKSQSYTYGVDIRAGGAYALKVGNGNTRLIGSTIIGADTTPSYTLDVRGHIRATENLIVSTNNTTGGGIILADDGDIVDLNDGYGSMRFSYGVGIYSANRGGSRVITLSNNGVVYSSGFYHNSYGSPDYFLTSDGGAKHWSWLDNYYLRLFRRINSSGSSTNSGTIPSSILEFKNGYPLHPDPEFAYGYNDMSTYDNNGSGATYLTRETSSTCGNSTGYVIKVTSGSGATPGYGGWYFADSTRANTDMTCIFRALIPSGVSVEFASNSIGSGGNSYWLTEHVGTGKWEWYAYHVKGGTSSLSSTNFYYVTTPCTWYISFANTYINTYGAWDGNARYVIGDDRSSSPIGALLQSGWGRNDNSPGGDTWIFLDTLGGTSSPWGIRHNQGDNSIGFIGSGTQWSRIPMYSGISGYIGSSLTVGSTANPSYTLDVRGTTRSTDRIYANEWIQFDNWTGLYSPNNNAHFYPNNTTSYGQWQLRGSRNGYSGIHFGDSTAWMTAMDNYWDKGVYQENWGWLWYFNARNGHYSIRTSSDFGADISLNGSVRTNSTYYGYGLYHLSYGSSEWLNRTDGGALYWPTAYDSRFYRQYTTENISMGSLWCGYGTGMSTQLGPTSSWWHIFSSGWSDNTYWISQIAVPTADGWDGNHMAYRTVHGSNYSWRTLLDNLGGWISWNYPIRFEGPNQSVYARLQYSSTSISGLTMHGGGQDYAFYIDSNGYSGAGDTGGLAIDNDGVTVFGAGDDGKVFRVINEDNVGDGAQFAVSKYNGSYVARWLTVGSQSYNTSYNLDVRGTTRSTNRIYSNEWIQFDNWTGLYSPNNGAHFYPNNTTSYGAWQLRGSRNGYSGIHFGESSHYMTLMDNYTDKGIYQEDQRWILYYNANNGCVSLRDSGNWTDISLWGNTWISGTLYSGGGHVHVGYNSSSWLFRSDGGMFYWPGAYDDRYLRYEGWWNSGSGQNVDDAHGMVFAYGDHNRPGNWGIVATFEEVRGSSYRLQFAGDGWDNMLYFRNRSADRGGWHTGWKKILSNADTYVSGSWGWINGTRIDWTEGSDRAAHLLINSSTWWSNWYWSGQSGQPTWLWGSNDGTNMYIWNPSNFNVNSATYAYHPYIYSNGVWSTWYWSGQSGQPSWVWGSNDGTNMYVWNPSNFRVSYADSAGYVSNADTVDNYHASGLLTSASLGASGNSTTLSVTVGGTTKTGSVTVPYASTVGISSISSNSDYNVVFRSGNYLYTDSGINYNPSTNVLSVGSIRYGYSSGGSNAGSSNWGDYGVLYCTSSGACTFNLPNSTYAKTGMVIYCVKKENGNATFVSSGCTLNWMHRNDGIYGASGSLTISNGAHNYKNIYICIYTAGGWFIASTDYTL